MPDESLKRLKKEAESRGCPFKLLIVDDEQQVQETLKEICELSSVLEVDLAISGQEALAKIQNKKFDLITVDLIMPEISGIDMISEIKKISPGMPVMIITGNATEKVVNEAGMVGANKVIYKPISVSELLKEITSALIN